MLWITLFLIKKALFRRPWQPEIPQNYDFHKYTAVQSAAPKVAYSFGGNK